MQATTTRPKIIVTADGAGVVSHAGSRLLADVADRTTVIGELSQALDVLRRPGTRHDPGRILVDLAVAVADGATTISEIDVLRDQGDSSSGRWRRTRRVGGCSTASTTPRSPGWLRRGRGLGRWCGTSMPNATAARSRPRVWPARTWTCWSSTSTPRS